MIDISFDFISDTPPGKDPDASSPTLRTYHQLLWSKPLPRGELFELDVTGPPYHLHHRSELGEFWLSSDAVVPSFRWLAPIIDQIYVELEEFMHIGYTIGGMMVFPANRVDGKMTINQRRGSHHQIKDRFDLTLECVRRHYLDEPGPLDETLARYADFFGLFGDFAGYVDFFHLQDAVDKDSLILTSQCFSRASMPRRCRQPSTNAGGIANARLSSLNPKSTDRGASPGGP